MVETIKTPDSIATEHHELHTQLKKIIQLGSETGKAASELSKILHRHLAKEEEYALPPLGLLHDLARGNVQPEMEKYIEVCEKLATNLPAMIDEHVLIKKQLTVLEKAAQLENHPGVKLFVQQLNAHVMQEEEILYPATILIGEYLKLFFDTE